MAKKPSTPVPTATGQLLIVPPEFESLTTETRRPLAMGCSRDGMERSLALSLLLESEWISAWKNCPLQFDCIAYMIGQYSLPTQEDKEHREWKTLLLLLSVDGEVYSVGSELAIASFGRAVASMGGRMPMDFPIKIQKLKGNGANEFMRLSIGGPGLFRRQPLPQLSLPEKSSRGNDSVGGDNIPF